MVIKASSIKQIDGLVADLRDGSPLKRESAIARLTLLGRRAVEPLLNIVESNEDPATRLAALRALEAIADPRALGRVLRAIDDRTSRVASAAVGAARPFLRGAHGAVVVDRLTALALDRSRDESIRVTAIRALADLETSTIAPLLEALAGDPSGIIRAAVDPVALELQVEGQDSIADVTRAAEGGALDNPSGLQRAIVRATASVPLPVLLRLVERSREREASAPPRHRAEWIAVRGTAHMALARRGSRLAVYDLRESLEAATAPLPADFLAAVSALGDASCLEAIAVAYTRSIRTADDWWRRQLGDSFRAIVKRERITRRHAVMRKIGKRWPEVFTNLLQ